MFVVAGIQGAKATQLAVCRVHSGTSEQQPHFGGHLWAFVGSLVALYTILAISMKAIPKLMTAAECLTSLLEIFIWRFH